jgi:uncharacterized membrane protein
MKQQVSATQPVTGLIYLFPFTVFVFVPVMTLFLNRLKKSGTESPSEVRKARGLTWLVLSLGGSSLIAFLLVLGFFGAGTRYLGDFMPALMVLSVPGF